MTALLILLVAIGFGFVIFWHELGHFLAAKWAGVRVEQFAVGFGNALVSYRKGLGLRFGSSGREYEQILQAQRDGNAPVGAGTVSPTEYRLNWIPLGGYVKMYGQEDLVASTNSPDADHYMNKPVGKRMVIISAGVVMNVILAAMLFTLLYFIGYHPPAPLIGTVLPGTPAQRAGLAVGDRIVSIDDTPMYSWMNVMVSSALLRPDRPAVFEIQPAATQDPAARRRIELVPERDRKTGMIGVGIGSSPRLQAVDPKLVPEEQQTLSKLFSADAMAVGPGETIVAVGDTRVEIDDYHVLDRAVREARGQPVPITVRTLGGTEDSRTVVPRLLELGGSGEEAGAGATDGHALAGLLPLVEVVGVQMTSPNFGKLLPGDVIEAISVVGTADRVLLPSFAEMRQVLGAAGKADRRVDVTVRRGQEHIQLAGLELTVVDRETGQYGLGFAPVTDSVATVLGGIAANSPAAGAGVPARGSVTDVEGLAVTSWHQVLAALQDAMSAGASTVDVTVRDGESPPATFTLNIDEKSRTAIAALHPIPLLTFVTDSSANPVTTTLKTRNPLTAIGWGLRETKDQIVQLYITLKRVTVDRTVSPKNLTGPVGIFQFGTVVARKGPMWIIWFLALISANLAVVNFLPIPILDGGHMVFLISEKITGKPPSPKVQTAALYAGLLLIVGLVLFVTYNDIQRLLL